MHNNKRILIRNLTILVGSTLGILAASMISPTLPAIRAYFQDVPNADFLVRLVLTLPALLIAIGALFSGVLLDRWGRKPVLVIALILFGLAGTSGYVLESLNGLLLSRVVLGLALAGTMSGFTTLIGDYFSGDKLNRFMGYQASAVNFSGVLFLVVGGYLANAGWRYPFLIHLLAFLVLPGVIFAVDETKIQTKSQQVSEAVKPKAFPAKTVVLIYGIIFATMVIFFMVPVEMPFLLTELTGADGRQVGLALALQTLVAAVVSLQYVRIKSRLSFQAITALVFLTMGLGYVVIPFSTGFAAVILGLLLSGIGVGLIFANANVWLVSSVPAAVRGRAVGGLTTALFLGQFMSPIFSQPVIRQFGLAGAFGVAGIVALLLAAVFMVVVCRESANETAVSRSEVE
jgi:MFS family permease